MKGKKEFTPEEAEVIIGLINKKVNANAQVQKTLRKRIRDLGFYASDFGIGGGYTKTDFLRVVTITNDKKEVAIPVKETLTNNLKTKTPNTEIISKMIYSFEPITTPEAKILILGTMPGKESLETNEYYANSRNQFWSIMFGCFNTPFSNKYNDKVQLLKNNHVALWDVLKNCDREGSLDRAIEKEELNDFTSFFKNHPAINCILFNGNASRAYYEQNVSIERKLELFSMPSTSPTNTWYSKEQKTNEWKRVIDAMLK